MAKLKDTCGIDKLYDIISSADFICVQDDDQWEHCGEFWISDGTLVMETQHFGVLTFILVDYLLECEVSPYSNIILTDYYELHFVKVIMIPFK